jgi:flagellar hook-basal body complex protein FliE
MNDLDTIYNRLNANNQLQRINSRDDFSEIDPSAQKPSFKEVLSDAFGQVDSLQKRADEIVIDFSKGTVDNLHDVMIAMEKANIGLKLAVEMRNKLLDGYNTIMNLRF